MMSAIAKKLRVGQRLICGCLLGAAVMCTLAQAQTRTWTGNGSSLNWSDFANWSGGHVPTGRGGETIDFLAVSPCHSSVQNITNRMAIRAISYEGANYTLSGSPIELYGAGITQNAAGSNTISANLLLGHQLTVGGSGDLGVSSIVS